MPTAWRYDRGPPGASSRTAPDSHRPWGWSPGKPSIRTGAPHGGEPGRKGAGAPPCSGVARCSRGTSTSVPAGRRGGSAELATWPDDTRKHEFAHLLDGQSPPSRRPRAARWTGRLPPGHDWRVDRPDESPRHRPWRAAILLAAASLVSVIAVVAASESYTRCTQTRTTALPDPCRGPLLLTGWLEVIALAWGLAHLVLGAVHGGARGARRQPFLPVSGGAGVAMAVLAVVLMPLLAIAWAIAYGISRSSSPHHHRQAAHEVAMSQLHHAGWERAVTLHRHLSTAGELPVAPPSDVLVPGPVHLDVPMQYARYYGQDVRYHQGSTIAFGAPAFVAGAMLAQTVTNLSAQRRAEALAAAQWRDVQMTRTVVTAWSTWCRAGHGQWLEFSHQAVMEYHASGWTVLMTFQDTAPLMLTGPDAWTHSVVFARLRYGDAWRQAPWLGRLTS